jgi:hypothetical protein
MTFYRCYRVDAAGNVLEIKWLRTDNDLEACEQASKFLTEGHWRALELWDGLRRVEFPGDNMECDNRL